MSVVLHAFSALEGRGSGQGQQGGQLDGVASNFGKDHRTTNRVMCFSAGPISAERCA